MNVLIHPLATEKAIRLIESDNVITFITDKRASKTQIKNEMETKFKVKVDDIKIVRTTKGTKKAYIRLNPANPAIDVATQFGLM